MKTKHLFDGVVDGGELGWVRCRVGGSFGGWEVGTVFATEGNDVGDWFCFVGGEV